MMHVKVIDTTSPYYEQRGVVFYELPEFRFVVALESGEVRVFKDYDLLMEVSG